MGVFGHMGDSQSILRVEGISKAFPGVQALSDVTLEADRGEILALVGENGAGKSTLIHILAGAHRPDGGRMILDGEEVSFHSTHEAEAAGISVVFQELSLVPNLYGGGERLCRTPAAEPAGPDRPAGDVPRDPGLAGPVPGRVPAEHAGRAAVDGQPADGGDHQGAGSQGQGAGAGRADFLAEPSGSRPPV